MGNFGEMVFSDVKLSQDIVERERSKSEWYWYYASHDFDDSLEFTVQLSKHSYNWLMRSLFKVTNNSVRMQGGRPMRWKNLKKAEERWS